MDKPWNTVHLIERDMRESNSGIYKLLRNCSRFQHFINKFVAWADTKKSVPTKMKVDTVSHFDLV